MAQSRLYLNRNLLLLFLGIILMLLVGCQTENEPTPTVESPTMEPLVESPTPTEAPVQVSTLRATEAPTEAPSPTSPVPSPTAPLTPTPSATPLPPPPEPTFYTIQPGDTLFAISEQYGVTPDMLAVANGYGSLDEFFLIAGTDIQIPLCEAHEIVAGNTLAAIAQLCDLTLDELVTYNIQLLAPLGSFDAVPVGFTLLIPQETSTPDALDCSLEPEREQVIEYQPGPGEGIYCLAQKYNLSTAAIIQSNIDRLSGENIYGEVPLLIPPLEGTIYIVTAEDIENGATLEDIAFWYDVEESAISDWNGNPVTGPLQEGQQLLVSNANLAFGPFQSATEPAEEESPNDG